MPSAFESLAAGLVVAVLSMAPATPAATEIAVDLELVLLADSSSSILGSEFDLQVAGYAAAFRDPLVIDAIRALPGDGIAVTLVLWSATFQQFDFVRWRHVRNTADAEDFARAVETLSRRFQGFGTATGEAMIFGAGQFGGNGFAGCRLVIDITSDEHSNQGIHPQSARDQIVGNGITINALAILDDAFDLETYLTDSVIGGPGAFVMAVETYRDFADAIMRKLVREISGTPVARAPSLRVGYISTEAPACGSSKASRPVG